MNDSVAPVFSDWPRLAPLLENLAGAKAGNGGSAWAALRRQGFERAVRLGFPSVRHEEWRYTSLTPLADLPFRLPPAPTAALPGVEALRPFFLGGETARRLVFVDGRYAPGLSQPGTPLAGLSLANLAAGAADWAGSVDQCAGAHENPMGALNTAFFQDGALLRLARGVAVEEPVHLLFVNTRAEAGATQHLRNLILVEPRARVSVFESYVSLVEGAYVTNAVTELAVGEGAEVEHGRLQTENVQAFHFGAVHAHLERASVLRSHSISLGARLARIDPRIVFRGEAGYALLNGLYLVQGDQLVDHHTVADHAQPHCESHEFYHGIMEDKGRGVFNGKIFVRPDAQKTDAKQTNRNLLLSPEASIDTKPQLEIFADDVKCTHGATVGQLDDDALFYLRARGIGEAEARRMLIHAFAHTAIERVQCAPFQLDLDRSVRAKLTGGKGEHD